MKRNYTLIRYGKDDPDNDIETLGRYFVKDGDTLSLSCEGTYDGVSLTMTDTKMIVEYIDQNKQPVKNEVFFPSLWLIEGVREGKVMVRMYGMADCYAQAIDSGRTLFFGKFGYRDCQIEKVRAFKLEGKNPLEAEGWDGHCPVCGYECELSEGAGGYYIYCSLCGPDTVPAVAQREGIIGFPPEAII